MQDQRRFLHSITRFSLSEDRAGQLAEALGSVDSWPDLLAQLELNALAPLMLQHIRTQRIVIAESRLMELKALAMRHRAAANARYRVCAELMQAFNQQSIPLIFLKGIVLAPLLYEDDSLRPMRDIDLLVPRKCLQRAGDVLRTLDFELPQDQPNRFMRDSHQLPNATRRQDGFTISVEIHHDALGRDLFDHLRYEDVADAVQLVAWRDLELPALTHEYMLHQLARHLEALHPGGILKLINVLDVSGYAEKFQQQIDWQRIQKDFPHVLNTLRCLHFITPLSESLQARLGGVAALPPDGVGEIMLSLRVILSSQDSLADKLRQLLLPPDWWLHLYYNVAPGNSLASARLFRHPLTVAAWLAKRFFAAVFR